MRFRILLLGLLILVLFKEVMFIGRENLVFLNVDESFMLLVYFWKFSLFKMVDILFIGELTLFRDFLMLE